MNIVVLSNVNLDILKQLLSAEHQVYQQAGFDQWIQTALNPDDSLMNFSPDAFFLLLDGNVLLETVPENMIDELSACITYIEKLAINFQNSRFYVSTIDFVKKQISMSKAIRPEYVLQHHWESELKRLMDSYSHIFVFDLRQLIEDTGRQTFYSDKMWYMGSIPYSMKGLTVLGQAIKSILAKSLTARKKVLILDLDNTLWGGVLGEEGIEGLTLSGSLMGAVFKDTQKRILELHKTGVLLAVVSKNNKEDALNAINTHPHMLLREDSFVEILANWDPKPQNIRLLAQILNLGLDSFVFLDDNPVEREVVALELPDVTVVDFPNDKANLPAVIQQIADEYFFIEKITDEDTVKTRQYKEESLRKASQSKYRSLDEYLKSLNITIILNEMHERQAERVAQLTQKTNQFNLTTKRFDTARLKEYASDPTNHIFVASVSDKYGDYGLVAVLMISIQKKSAQIDNFLMSCRVMGRCIEDAVIAAVESVLLERYSVDTVFAKYIPTGKNVPVQHLMERLDFVMERESNQGDREYSRSLGSELKERKLLFSASVI